MTGTIELKDAYKGFTLDQDKIMSPEETVQRFKRKLARLDLDILQEAIRIDNGRLDIPIFFSRCGKDALKTIGTKKQMGKGATPAQAEASAVMELAERFSFFSFCKNPQNFFTSTYNNIPSGAIPFEQIALSVHDDSSDLPLVREFFNEMPFQWTKAYNLTRQEPVLIPFDWFYTINEFNGPSAGNCVEEALSQGICEIIERHVSSIVSRQQLRVPAIDPESATDPMVKEMLRKYSQAGVLLFLSDFSLDTGIPTVGVLAYDPQTFPHKSEIVWTAGTTPDPQKALSRALTEVAQLAGDFNSGANYVASGLPKFNDIAQAEFITHPETSVPISTLPDLSNDNIKIEVHNCLEVLSARGMEVILVDTRHPLLDIPAFYTIIPGAHFRERAQGTSVGMFLGKMITETKDPLSAINDLSRLDATLPEKYYVQFYLGLCHHRLQNAPEALTLFKRALTLNPNAEDRAAICSYAGDCLKDMGEYREALKILREGETYDQERTDIYNLMGFCHFKLKEHEAAIEAFKKILTLDPSSAINYANIASNYRDMGQTTKAKLFYKMALELDPGIDFARENLARLSAKIDTP